MRAKLCLMTRQILGLGGFLLLVLAAAGLGGSATAGSVKTWYPALIKPAWTPPAGSFGPVWTVLYLAMAMAAWLVWRGDPAHPWRRPALLAWSAQLVLNAAWSVIFFGWQRPGYAVLEIVVLWAAILVTLVCCSKVHGVAAWLLLPYLVWVTVAAALNFEIWRLNR